jgi:hypothetical protein
MSKVQEILKNIKQLFEAAENPIQLKEYKLADGTAITCDKLEVGGVAKVGDAPAAAGEYKLEDGSSITVGEAGAITAVTPKQVEPEDMSTPEGIAKAYAKFAEGTIDLAGVSTILKALMEYSFGWQLREQEEKAAKEAAMKVYKDTLAVTQGQVEQQTALLKQMFALVTEMAGAPISDPPPNPKKKFSFGKVDDRNKVVSKYQEAAAKLKEEWAKLKIA